MNINQVNRGITKNKKPLRLGRGTGTGQGKTAGRGHKGQRSHGGWNQPHSFQGGMSPLVRRIPKRGFFNSYGLTVGVVNIGDLEEFYKAGEEVNSQTLKEKNLLKGRYDVLKILGNGEITKKLKIVAHRFSNTAREKVEKAGGELVVLPPKVPVEDKKEAARALKGPKKATAKK